MGIKRFDVYLINLDPTIGHEIRKTRPALIISPDELNRHICTVIIAPMTTKSHDYPSRVPCIFQGTHGYIVIDQIRAVDKTRLVKKLGTISNSSQEKVIDVLAEMFSK